MLTIKNLSKRYTNDQLAVDNFSFEVKEGRCFGLLGPNGAGKSTVMKIMAGIIQADQGELSILDQSVSGKQNDIKRFVGYVPQDVTLYEQLNAYQNLRFFGKMYGLRGKLLEQRITEVLGQVGLSDRAGDVIRTYSGGMKRRINIAAALLHTPKLVIMDEPTVGIDPQSRHYIFELIRQMKQAGTTIIYSTHYMEEAEGLCDELLIMDHGKLLVQGAMTDVLEQHALPAVYVEAENWEGPKQLPSTVAVTAQGSGWRIECSNALQVLHDLSKELLASGHRIKALELQQPSLSSVFMKLTGTALRD